MNTCQHNYLDILFFVKSHGRKYIIRNMIKDTIQILRNSIHYRIHDGMLMFLVDNNEEYQLLRKIILVHTCVICSPNNIVTSCRVHFFYHKSMWKNLIDGDIMDTCFFEELNSGSIIHVNNINLQELDFDSNIISCYLLIKIFGVREFFIEKIIFRRVFKKFLLDDNYEHINEHINEIMPKIKTIVEYFKKCYSNYRYKILKDDMIFDKPMLQDIKTLLIKYFFGANVRPLHSLAKLTFLFTKIEYELFNN